MSRKNIFEGPPRPTCGMALALGTSSTPVVTLALGTSSTPNRPPHLLLYVNPAEDDSVSETVSEAVVVGLLSLSVSEDGQEDACFWVVSDEKDLSRG